MIFDWVSINNEIDHKKMAYLRAILPLSESLSLEELDLELRRNFLFHQGLFVSLD
jgi:hypothetical protein